MALDVKVAGVGIIVTFVAVLVEVIFIPLIQTKLSELKLTAPSVSVNSTLNTMVELLYYTPLGTILVGFIGSFAMAFAMGGKK